MKELRVLIESIFLHGSGWAERILSHWERYLPNSSKSSPHTVALSACLEDSRIQEAFNGPFLGS